MFQYRQGILQCAESQVQLILLILAIHVLFTDAFPFPQSGTVGTRLEKAKSSMAFTTLTTEVPQLTLITDGDNTGITKLPHQGWISTPEPHGTTTVEKDSIKIHENPIKADSNHVLIGIPKRYKVPSSERTKVSQRKQITKPQVQKHTVLATENQTTTTSSIRSSLSRSSTMPGYRIPTQKQQMQKRLLRQIQDQTGQDDTSRSKAQDWDSSKYSSTSHKKVQSRGGDAMYQSCSSVPESLVQFAKELHQEERITPDEEIQLGLLTQEAIRIQSLHTHLTTLLRREPTNEEWCTAVGKGSIEILRQALEQGMEAKNKLVTSNLRLVQGVVNVYIRNGLSGQYNAGDMMQEGVMALIRAAEKFEPQRGLRFSTYAMYWIRAAVKRSQTTQSRVITIPQRLHANHKRVMMVQKEMVQALGRQPNQDELANAVCMSEAQLGRCLKAMEQRCFSLDQKIQNRNKSSAAPECKDSLYDVLESTTDDSDGSLYNSMSGYFLRESLTESIYRFLDRESAHMIMLRFGLVNDPHILPRGYEGPLTIVQVSQLMGMKPDQVRRRIIKSLEKLKFSMGNEWHDYGRVVE